MHPIDDKYVPPPKRERHGIALALSGGGYRAPLFHLGAVRRLNELGVLPQLTTFGSVSGGSILNAQLATNLPWPLTVRMSDVEWNRRVGAPIRSFTSQDIRTDLDRFSDAEQAVLENHGYFLADAALKRHAPQLITNSQAQLEIPNPGWMDESKVPNALKNSSKNRLLGH